MTPPPPGLAYNPFRPPPHHQLERRYTVVNIYTINQYLLLQTGTAAAAAVTGKVTDPRTLIDS